jgi:CelD/BcsL family acetyltransferase involved in cellulose biosynthesis
MSRVTSFDALGLQWRDLESRSAASFFQSWTWAGCLAEQRFDDPVLVQAQEDGRIVALALFNRRGRSLYLGESGDPAQDCVFTEFNDVLSAFGREAELTAACLGAARSWRSGVARRRLVLSGVTSATAAAASETGTVRHNTTMSAPFVDLAAQGECFLQRRSANTRQQLRRSNRHYGAIGAVTIERADTLARALEFLDALEVLHQKSWIARGRPGAFANPFFGRFHRELIERGMARGEIDLLRVAAGALTIGMLYNFRYRGGSLAYQSGFDYAGGGPHAKPGLTCHHEAIRYAARWGLTRYEFLAGDDRYKRSLSDKADTLHWIEVANRYSPRSLARRAWDRFQAGTR